MEFDFRLANNYDLDRIIKIFSDATQPIGKISNKDMFTLFGMKYFNYSAN